MESAALIQQQMLPTPAADPSGRCDVYAAMKPARDVGGDLYDVIWLDDRRVALAVGDVCGKGVPASLFMCVTVTMLRLAAREDQPLAEMMRKVNAHLFAQNPTSMFTTLCFGILDVEARTFEYVNCGHNPPYHLKRNGWLAAVQTGGPPLGILPDKRWPAYTLTLGPGEGVFLFTDGVTEAMDAAKREYGETRLESALSAHATLSVHALVDAVVADVQRFAAGAEQADDITCLAARVA